MFFDRNIFNSSMNLFGNMRKYAYLTGMIFSIILISFIGPSFSEISSPKKQLEAGVAIEDILCKENRVLVIRDNGNPACVSEKTAERKNWEIIKAIFATNDPITETQRIEGDNLQEYYKTLYPAPKGLEEAPQDNTEFTRHIHNNEYPFISYEDLFRSWNYPESWIHEFFKENPGLKYELTFVKDDICQDGVFFEDPLNILKKDESWFSWNYLDCIKPEHLLHDLSHYDYYTRDEGLKMLTNYHEADGTIHKKVDFLTGFTYNLGPPCDYVYYHIFEHPQRVKIGEPFLLNVTYSWIKPNGDWGSATLDDKNRLLSLGEDARSLEMQEHLLKEKLKKLKEDNIKNQADIIQIQKELHTIDNTLDLLHEQFYAILEKYDDVNHSEIDMLLDHEFTNTSLGFDKRDIRDGCEPSISYVLPREMDFVNPDELDGHGFSSYSHRTFAIKNIPFNNTAPQTVSYQFIINQPIYDLYSIIDIGVGKPKQAFFTISTDSEYAYFGDNVYHEFETRNYETYCCDNKPHHRPNEKGPPMILYAEYLQENYPYANKAFIENDLNIKIPSALEDYVDVFLSTYPEFNR